MVNRPGETAFRDIDALFRLGIVAGLSDGQLLERFTAGGDSDAPLAFEAIVRRHGPMVLGVCRRVLGDYHAAEDAFQVTFLVLALRARAVRKRESLGPWLHGVAARIARRALVSGRRRREGPLPSGGLVEPGGRDPAVAELNAVLDEEVGRLPDKYRRPIILCYLEGRTQEEAARMLGWTKGTVSGRLARGKEVLRARLMRRGLAPSAGLVAASLPSPTVSAAVPASLLVPTVRAAIAAVLGGAETGLVMGQVASLAREALTRMLLGRLVRVAAPVLLLGLGAALAAPVLRPGGPAHRGNPGGGPVAATARLADRPRPDPRAPRLDRFGDPLPPRARMRLGTTQRRHTTAVVGVDFTPDGKAAVSAQSDGLVRFWDPDSGRQVSTINMAGDDPAHDQTIRKFAISPDGGVLATAGFGFDPARRLVIQSVRIWDLNEGRLWRTIEVKTPDLFCLAFSPDGATLATGAFAGEIQLWDVATGACLSTLSLGLNGVPTLAFAPDGKTLAVGAQGSRLILCDLERGRRTLLGDPSGSPFPPCFSPDGRLIAANTLGGEAVLWDRATGRKHLTAGGVAYAFAPDSRSLAMTGSTGGTLTVIDAESGRELWNADLGWGLRTAGLAFSPDGKTIIAGRGDVLRLFEAESGRERLGNPEAHQGSVSVVRYSPDGGAILTAGDDGTVRQWDAASGRQLRVIPHGGRVHRLAVSPDGRSLATAAQSPDTAVRVWDLATGRLRQEWPGHGDATGAEAVAFSADGGLLLSYGRDHRLKVREVATGRERDAVQPRFVLAGGDELDSLIIDGAFAPGNPFLAVRTYTIAHVADLATGEERLSTPSDAMAFAPDGQSFALAVPGRPAERELADGRVWSGGSISDGIDLVDISSGKRKRLEVPRDRVAALAFAPDGNVVAVAGGWRQPMIRLYRTDSGREIEAFTCPAAHTHPGALAFSPDGRSLAAGLDDTTVVIWDVRDVH